MSELQQPQEARRWAKFPATLLFALSLVWLVRMVFQFLLDPASVADETRTGIGSLRFLYELAIIPLGSVLCGLGVLFLQPWAYLPASLLPLWPLVAVTIEKVLRIDAKFSQFHQSQNFAALGNGILDCLALLGLWAIYLLAVLYLRKSYLLLGGWYSWGKAPSKQLAGARPTPQFAGIGGQPDEGEDCWLMPEVDNDDDDKA